MPPYTHRTTEKGTSIIRTGRHIIGTVAVEIVPENLARRSVYIQNISANDLFVGGDPDELTTEGVKVYANGGYITIYTTQAVYGVATDQGSDIRYLEESHE